MKALAAPIASFGAKIVAGFTTATQMFAFFVAALSVLLDRATWNRATFDVVVKQVYFTAVQIVWPFMTYVVVISWLLISIIVQAAQDYGLAELAAETTIRVLVLELLPFLTALFVALRSGSAINTEVALMRVNNELDALDHCRVTPMQFEFLPRLIGGMVSVTCLAGMAGVLALIQAYFAIYGAASAGFELYTQTIARIFSVWTLVGLTVKCALFGLAVTLIPIVTGLATPKKAFMVPVSVLRGMMRVFFAIVAIEVLSLALRYV